MNIPLDESLPGFLLRQQMVFADAFAPKGVISRDGQWYREPYAHHEVLHIFHRFDDLFLLETIDIGKRIGRVGHGLFDAPSAYYHKLYSTFLTGERLVTNRADKKEIIKFCPECIVGAIKNFGFGYFKYNWHQTHWCYEHEMSLYHLQSTSYRDTLIDITRVIYGEIIQNAVKMVSVRPPKKTNPSETSQEKPEFVFPVRAAECVGEMIGYILLKDLNNLFKFNHFFDIDEWQQLGEDLLLWQKDHVRFMNAVQIIENVIILLNHYDKFNANLQHVVEYVKVTVSPRKQFSEIMMVSKHRHCDSCPKYRYCAVTGSGTEGITERIDLHFLLQNSTSLKRYAFDNGWILLTGDHIWSPFRVRTKPLNEAPGKQEKIIFNL
ncbi:hypothetical protein [Citrobacter werkmanii]|uniref:hypothetical protein n=1 Tax=Citrobacter werkmanii TaxID=67827 RepID=UPI002651843F|nr:hypothetical protein [Citrobacter werkmanii]MDN8558372.1 hypothetical protein [Citrobacter werkmanii]